MTTDLEIHRPAALAIRPGQEMFSDKQRAALAVLGIKNATSADLAVFMHVCQNTGLDPFTRQIHGIMRREKVTEYVNGQKTEKWLDKFTIQVGIDGFRVIRDRIADRKGLRVEYEDTLWYDAGGTSRDVWLEDYPPAACRVVVLVDGRRFPSVLKFSEYCQYKDGRPIAQWATKPAHMIEKCAEANGLRRAFPNDMAGIYLEDELPPPPPPPQAQAPRPTRVTAAEITGRPPAGNGHQAPLDEEPKREDPPESPRSDGEQDGRAPRAGKTALAQLDRLLRRLPLGPPEDVKVLLEWLCGGPYTASRDQVRDVTAFLGAKLEDAQGDTEEAAAAVWAAYRAVTAQDQADNPEATDGE
jgi:phage recombination protein Bet